MIMSDELFFKLWVIKFCLKVIYPKYNFFVFLVYLAIKYRINNTKLSQGKNIMDVYKMRTIPEHVQRLSLADSLEDNISVYSNKCLLISKEKFIELAVENLFYLDNGLLWIGMKLSPECKQKYSKTGSTRDKHFMKYNLNYVASEIHKKLWQDDDDSVDKVRIVPVAGSKLVRENMVLTCESEYFNTLSTFGLKSNESNVEVTFHPVPSLSCNPTIASVAEVNLIANDYDLDTDFIKEILNNHFILPKLLHPKDVFNIELTPEVTAKYYYKYIDLVQSTGMLHFKCKKLTSTTFSESAEDEDLKATNNYNEFNIDKPCFIVKGVTQLTLGENIHGMKPKNEFFKQHGKLNTTLIQSCPYGMKKKFKQMQEAISPFLEGNLNVLLSSLSAPIIPMFLLTGSIGSGRHLLVKTLAKYNGMNCLQMDCNALQSSTAKQTESKINATIQKAKAASPVIMLLDNFEVFAVDPENNEDCRVVEYFINSIVTLYQNYTKHSIIFVALTDRPDLKPNILRIFLEKFHIPKLKQDERMEILQWFTTIMQLNFNNNTDKSTSDTININNKPPMESSVNDILQRVAAKTETFLYGDMDTLVHFALRESYLKQQNNSSELANCTGLSNVNEEDFNSALGKAFHFFLPYLTWYKRNPD